MVARTDDVESAVEMTLDGAQGKSSDSGDLGDIHLFEEAKQEDGALAGGEAGDRFPDAPYLLLTDELCFCGAFAVGHAGSDVRDIDGIGGNVLPEAEAAGAGVVAGQVEGDADQPGGDGA